MTQAPHEFGGEWTDEKLERVRKYLAAYTTIMSKQRFRIAYVDAFAGTGYRSLRHEENPDELMFPEIAEQESQQFLDGSARIALRVDPRFHKYIFIENDEKRFRELERLRKEFPAVQSDIILVNADANAYLQDWCENHKWAKHRAVLFLDPYGMEVEWQTIEAVAKTQAIDLWLLFPLGIAVNRLLRKDGQIDPVMRAKLDRLFGATDWYEVFYRTIKRQGLFGEETRIEKVGGFDAIAAYFVRRLKTVFASVAENPLPLYNSRNNPLYLLCFAAGNPRGALTAVKIAQNILKKKNKVKAWQTVQLSNGPNRPGTRSRAARRSVRDANTVTRSGWPSDCKRWDSRITPTVSS
jgi:three-Cys-motif partner protein